MKRKDMLFKFKMLQDRNMQTVRDKNKTYGADGDAFQAFKDAVSYGSKIETQPQALWNMMSKHLVTAKRWVDGGVVPSEAEAAEKLGDIAIYMSLLELMFEDKRNDGIEICRITSTNGLEVNGSAYTRITDVSKDEVAGEVDCGRPRCVDCDHAQDGDTCGLTGNPTAETRSPGRNCGPEGRNFKPAFVHICNGCRYLNGVHCAHEDHLGSSALEIRKDESQCGDKAKWYKPGLGKSLKRETERPEEANGVSCKTCLYHDVKGYILCGKYGDLAEDARQDGSRCGLEGKSWTVAPI